MSMGSLRKHSLSALLSATLHIKTGRIEYSHSFAWYEVAYITSIKHTPLPYCHKKLVLVYLLLFLFFIMDTFSSITVLLISVLNLVILFLLLFLQFLFEPLLILWQVSLDWWVYWVATYKRSSAMQSTGRTHCKGRGEGGVEVYASSNTQKASSVTVHMNCT